MITYKDAGVDVTRGYDVVNRIKNRVKSTFSPAVLTELGSFGGLFQLDWAKYKTPVLVSATDGVGTKLKLAFKRNKHDTVGIDLVAMCVNDLLCTGAKPLFFLDYIATSRLVPEKIEQIVNGIADGCQQAECALIGGETAEMPDFYAEGEYDLAGFAVGIVEKENIIDGKTITEGDVILGLPSSGIHANGFSLIRKLFDLETLDESYGEQIIGDILLEPTRIYVKPVLQLIEEYQIKAIAHITGGGFIENIPRVFSDEYTAVINQNSWQIPDIFRLIQEKSNLNATEMFNTFNMGIGLILIVAGEDADGVMKKFAHMDEIVYKIGDIVCRKGEKICFV